jgi:probable rRNA maturation factor
MIKVSFNVDEPFWAKEMPLFKKSILKATKETLNTACEVKQNNLEVNFLLTSDFNIRLLNKNYRNKDKSTNVLAFPMNQNTNSESYTVGDIAISLQKILSESKKLRIQKYKYLSKITIHGVLHLLGFDHKSNKQYDEMNKIEKRVFEKIFCK